MKTAFVCRAFYRCARQSDGAWCLSQYDVPHYDGPILKSPHKAQLAIYHMVNELEDKGCVVLEAQAHEITVDTDGIVRALKSFTVVSFDYTLLGVRAAGGINGTTHQQPRWEAVQEICLSPPFDDERANIYGDTVQVEVGTEMPPVSQPNRIFANAA